MNVVPRTDVVNRLVKEEHLSLREAIDLINQKLSSCRVLPVEITSPLFNTPAVRRKVEEMVRGAGYRVVWKGDTIALE